MYLLGGTLYLLLTGGLYPHEAGKAGLAVARAREGIIRPPGIAAPGRYIPKELEDLCLHALAKNPADRVSSVAEFLQRLGDYLSGAHRRRQSNEATEKAAQQIAELARDRAEGSLSPLQGYQRHGAIAETTARALELWSENQQARSLRRQNLLTWIEAEIAHDDLLLARVHLEELRESAPGEAGTWTPLEEQLQEAELRRRFHRRQRVALAWAAALLFCCAIGFALVSRRSRIAAERSLAVAKEQGSGSRKLVNFILTQLKDELEKELTVGTTLTFPVANEMKHNIAEGVGERVRDYYLGLDTTAWPADMKHGLGVQMRQAGNTFYRLEDLDNSMLLLEKSLELLREGETDGHDEALCLFLIGEIARLRGDLRTAAQFLREAMRVMRKAHGPSNPELVELHVSVSDILYADGNYEEAFSELEKAEHIVDSTGNVSKLSEFRVRLSLGKIQAARGFSDEAGVHYREAIRIAEENFAPDSPDLGAALGNFSVFLLTRNRPDEAIPLLQRQLELSLRQDGPNHPDAGRARINLGDAYLRKRQNTDAKETLLEAVRILAAAFGENHPEVASALNALGVAHLRLDEDEEGLAALRRALAIREHHFGPDNPTVAISILNIGTSLHSEKRYEEALEYFQRAVAAFDRQPGGKTELLGTGLYNLGSTLDKLGRREEALPPYLRSLEIRAALEGADVPRHATQRGIIARLHRELGDHAKSIAQSEDALRLTGLAKEPDRSLQEALHGSLAASHAGRGDFAASRAHLDLVLQLSRELAPEDSKDPDNTITRVIRVLARRSRELAADGAPAEEQHRYARQTHDLIQLLSPEWQGGVLNRLNMAECLQVLGRDEEAAAIVRSLEADDFNAENNADNRQAWERLKEQYPPEPAP